MKITETAEAVKEERNREPGRGEEPDRNREPGRGEEPGWDEEPGRNREPGRSGEAGREAQGDLTEKKDLPIGVFDSGVGGISVLRELVKLMPAEDFLFLGDSANAPYGIRGVERIRELTLLRAKELYDEGIKALVVACNTATSAAIRDLRQIYTDIPVIGIEPAIKPAAMVKEHPRVLVMATPGTVRGEKFQHLMHGFEDRADVIAVPCPGLVEYIERGELSGAGLEERLRSLLGPYLDRHPDAVVLGCTHYPFIRGAVAGIVGKDVPILDGSAGTARETRRRLGEQGLLREREEAGQVTFRMTLPGKEPLCRMLLAQDGL